MCCTRDIQVYDNEPLSNQRGQTIIFNLVTSTITQIVTDCHWIVVTVRGEYYASHTCDIAMKTMGCSKVDVKQGKYIQCHVLPDPGQRNPIGKWLGSNNSVKKLLLLIYMGGIY